MDYIIEGEHPLCGELPVYGAKNCALALLGATVLTKEEVTLFHCPQIVDVENMLALLRALGKRVERCGDTVYVEGDVSVCVPRENAKLLRGSGLVLGGLVGTFGEAFLPSTGGCAIGSRPIDIHLDGLRAMGVDVLQTDGGVKCHGRPLGCNFTLRFPSVGATENLLCAAVCACGTTELHNCAIEPEVVALENFLVKMGAKIKGIGTSKLTVCGNGNAFGAARRLHGTDFCVIPDRIVACTYLACAAAAGGKISVTDCIPQHFRSFLHILRPRFDMKVYDTAVSFCAKARPKDYGDVVTAPYPAFPTDVQQLLLSLCALSGGGTSTVTETLFENRLAHNAEQLNKMGANVTVCGNKATVVGQNLFGTEVFAHDLRGGAGLAVAALGAAGCTNIKNAEHVLRGYRDFDEVLRAVGAKIFVVG